MIKLSAKKYRCVSCGDERYSSDYLKLGHYCIECDKWLEEIVVIRRNITFFQEKYKMLLREKLAPRIITEMKQCSLVLDDKKSILRGLIDRNNYTDFDVKYFFEKISPWIVRR